MTVCPEKMGGLRVHVGSLSISSSPVALGIERTPNASHLSK